MNKIKKKIKNRKGFTLVELIVVIAILGILAAIAIPRLFGFTDQARVAADEEAAAVLANATKMYVAANGIDSTTPFEVSDLYDAGLVDGDIEFTSNKYESTTTEIDINYDADTGEVTVKSKGGDVVNKNQ